MAKFTFAMDSRALDAQLKEALKRSPKATAKAITAIALDLSAKSAKRAPIESGDLRRNCTADIGSRTVFTDEKPTGATAAPGNKVQASIGYSLPYALRQHEDLSLRHDRTDGRRLADGRTVNLIAGGEAKYLERPFNENTQRYIDLISKIPEEVLE